VVCGHICFLIKSKMGGGQVASDTSRRVRQPTYFHPRQVLLRVWFVVRTTYIGSGLLQITQADYTYPRRHTTYLPDMPYEIRNGWVLSYVVSGATFLVCGAMASPRLRGRIRRALAHLSRGGDEIQQAAMIAVMLGADASEIALQRAKLEFFSVSFNDLDESCFEIPKAESAHAARRQALRARSPGFELGTCDAFVSHTYVDPEAPKFAALHSWTNSLASPPRLWIDSLCLSRVDAAASLANLPIFIAGCASFLALTSRNLSSRLWCATELFTWIQIGKSRERIILRPIDDGLTSSTIFDNFDVAKAECSCPADRETLLSIIEASFGDIRRFNQVMCNLLTAIA